MQYKVLIYWRNDFKDPKHKNWYAKDIGLSYLRYYNIIKVYIVRWRESNKMRQRYSKSKYNEKISLSVLLHLT